MIGPYELNTIITGNAQELSDAIPDGSVDFVFGDPVYERVQDYAWMAETAARILKDDRPCLAWTSTKKAHAVQTVMEGCGLTYQWTLNYVVPAKPNAIHLYGVFMWNTQCLYFSKGRFKASPYIPDTFISQMPPNNGFKWNKNLAVIERWLESFSKLGDLVFDPFAGSGSVPVACKRTGRNYLAFEIDPQRAVEARQRVEQAAMYLPYQQPEQVTSEHLRVPV